MNSLLTNRDERIQQLEEDNATMESAKLRVESMEYEIQANYNRICSISELHYPN